MVEGEEQEQEEEGEEEEQEEERQEVRWTPGRQLQGCPYRLFCRNTTSLIRCVHVGTVLAERGG